MALVFCSLRIGRLTWLVYAADARRSGKHPRARLWWTDEAPSKATESQLGLVSLAICVKRSRCQLVEVNRRCCDEADPSQFDPIRTPRCILRRLRFLRFDRPHLRGRR